MEQRFLALFQSSDTSSEVLAGFALLRKKYIRDPQKPAALAAGTHARFLREVLDATQLQQLIA